MTERYPEEVPQHSPAANICNSIVRRMRSMRGSRAIPATIGLIIAIAGCTLPARVAPLEGVVPGGNELPAPDLARFDSMVSQPVGLILSKNTRNYANYLANFPKAFYSDADRTRANEIGSDTAGQAGKVIAVLKNYFPRLDLAQGIGDPTRSFYVVYDHVEMPEMVGVGRHRANTQLKFIVLDSSGRVIASLTGSGSKETSFSGMATEQALQPAVLYSFETALGKLDEQLRTLFTR